MWSPVKWSFLVLGGPGRSIVQETTSSVPTLSPSIETFSMAENRPSDSVIVAGVEVVWDSRCCVQYRLSLGTGKAGPAVQDSVIVLEVEGEEVTTDIQVGGT